MLQIISGKFFESSDRFAYDAKGILYSNFAWVQPIKTCVATLEPVDTYASVSSYVVCYVNQIEKEQPPRAGVLVRTGDAEIIEQFQILCGFGLKSFFHQDKDTVAISCRDYRLSSSDDVPSSFIPRIFSRQINGTSEEIDLFVKFTEDVIALKRDVYKRLISSLRSYTHALQIISHNIDLSYSLFVYSMEALAQNFDKYAAVWDDYHDEVRSELDNVLTNVSSEIAEGVRKILLRNSNLRATRRFIRFVTSHIDKEFFIKEAPVGYTAIKRSELERALKNAYLMRSKFAHQLQPIQDQLRYPNFIKGDVFRISGEPFLSIAGLARISHHVLTNFVRRSEKVEKERILWRNELPGIIRMEMAPEYWIWKHEGLKPEHATSKLSGFLSQLETALISKKPLTDIRKLLEKYVELLPTAKSIYKIQMIVTYVLYNAFVKEDRRCIDYNSNFNKFQKEFDSCMVETMLTRLLMGEEWPWSSHECEEAWEKYVNNKYIKSSISIPPLMNIALIVEIGQQCLREGKRDKYNEWMETAILDAAGYQKIQTFLMDKKKTYQSINGMEIFSIEKK